MDNKFYLSVYGFINFITGSAACYFLQRQDYPIVLLICLIAILPLSIIAKSKLLKK